MRAVPSVGQSAVFPVGTRILTRLHIVDSRGRRVGKVLFEGPEIVNGDPFEPVRDEVEEDPRMSGAGVPVAECVEGDTRKVAPTGTDGQVGRRSQHACRPGVAPTDETHV